MKMKRRRTIQITPRRLRGLLRHETLQTPNRAQSGRPPAETKRRRRTKRRRTIQITPRGPRGLLRHETLQAPNRADVHRQKRREEEERREEEQSKLRRGGTVACFVTRRCRRQIERASTGRHEEKRRANTPIRTTEKNGREEQQK